MVKVLLVLVISAYNHWHEVSPAVLCGIGVHDPLVTRDGYRYRTGRTQIMYGQGNLLYSVEVVERCNVDMQVLIVEVLAGIDLKRLLRHLARHNHHGTCVAGQRHAVNKQLGTLRIRTLIEIEPVIIVCALRLLALVCQV